MALLGSASFRFFFGLMALAAVGRPMLAWSQEPAGDAVVARLDAGGVRISRDEDGRVTALDRLQFLKDEDFANLCTTADSGPTKKTFARQRNSSQGVDGYGGFGYFPSPAAKTSSTLTAKPGSSLETAVSPGPNLP